MTSVPKHIQKKVTRMNELMDKIVDLNMELEKWLEERGAKDGFDFTYEHRESVGYSIQDVNGFYGKVERELGRKI